MNKIDFELYLLNVWERNKINTIYKYKGRIKWYSPFNYIELFYDINNEFFTELDDIASIDCEPADGTKDVCDLINNRID